MQSGESSQEIIDHLARESADNRFLAFCLGQHGEECDVEQGSLLLAQSRYPDINVAAYQALFDSFAGDLRERIDFGSNPEQILATINQYLVYALALGLGEKELRKMLTVVPESEYNNYFPWLS